MTTNRLVDLGLLLIRVMVGVVFVYHGQGKLFGGLEGFAGALQSMGVPAPQLAAWVVALSEFGGGLVLIAGVAFRYALWPLFITMMVASFKAHAGRFSLQDGGMEFALTLGVVVLGLILTGPGGLSLERFLPRRGKRRGGGPG
ncbi:MAG: DoxX family protein [Krumholzibacteria bacterium]|nr:DoxX family protein [Candidatus Krumholzibacteria bacterium]